MKTQIGDTVHVRGKIIADGVEGVHVRFARGDRANVAYGDIVHVEPLPLAVGDRVNTAAAENPTTGEIIAIHKTCAWVRYDAIGGDAYALRSLDQLVRA